MRILGFFAILLALTSLGLTAPGALANEEWRELLKSADAAELRQDHARSISEYKKALRMVPANEENVRAKIDAELSTALIAAQRYEDVTPYCQDLVAVVRRLKAANRLDADVIWSIQSLKDAMGAVLPQNLPFDRLQKVFMQFIELRSSIYEAIDPNAPEAITLRTIAARDWVSKGKDQHAQTELEKILTKCKPKSDESINVRSCIAALQAKHGHTQMTNDLEQELRQKYSAAKTLRLIAVGKLWAQDYKGGLETLDRAQAKLDKPVKNWEEQAKINDLFVDVCVGKNDLSSAASLLKKNLAYLMTVPQSSKAQEICRFRLVDTLHRLHRTKEAEQFQPSRAVNRNAEFEFMLTDDERKAVAKEKSKAVPH